MLSAASPQPAATLCHTAEQAEDAAAYLEQDEGQEHDHLEAREIPGGFVGTAHLLAADEPAMLIFIETPEVEQKRDAEEYQKNEFWSYERQCTGRKREQDCRPENHRCGVVLKRLPGIGH